jgi:hypothetical protein
VPAVSDAMIVNTGRNVNWSTIAFSEFGAKLLKR